MRFDPEPRPDGLCPGTDSGTRPHRPHKNDGPQGPNEDVGQCPRCLAIIGRLRPEGDTFGGHTPDCSLPFRHTGFCEP